MLLLLVFYFSSALPNFEQLKHKFYILQASTDVVTQFIMRWVVQVGHHRLFSLYFWTDRNVMSQMISENILVEYDANLLAFTWSPPLFTADATDGWSLFLIPLLGTTSMCFRSSYGKLPPVPRFTELWLSLAYLRTLSVSVANFWIRR